MMAAHLCTVPDFYFVLAPACFGGRGDRRFTEQRLTTIIITLGVNFRKCDESAHWLHGVPAAAFCDSLPPRCRRVGIELSGEIHQKALSIQEKQAGIQNNSKAHPEYIGQEK